jgi:prepilin-type N-terminal cleavage/methylation domain-containing protein
MRSFVRNYIQAEKARREESGEAGFSLIELIVVVVILGILAAVAIPIFLGLQGQAEDSARESVAANASSQLAAKLGVNPDYAFAEDDFASLKDGDKYDISVNSYTGLEDFCVTVAETGKTSATAGPGCPPPATTP